MNSITSKILLVDDDELSQRMMGLLISEKGYSYDIASNGAEAIKAIQSHAYDIVLMDLQMPVMDGFEATSRIRNWEAENRHTPIVALTAMLFHDERQKCLSVGMDDCIAKPFNTEILFRLIDTYINKPKSPGSKNGSQKPAIADNLETLDVREALPRFGNDLDIYQDFLNEFIDNLPERIDQLRAAFQSADFKKLAESAHNLKGISASMGAKQLAYLSQKLDRKSRDSDLSEVQQTLEEIENCAGMFENEAIVILSRLIRQQEII